MRNNFLEISPGNSGVRMLSLEFLQSPPLYGKGGQKRSHWPVTATGESSLPLFSFLIFSPAVQPLHTGDHSTSRSLPRLWKSTYVCARAQDTADASQLVRAVMPLPRWLQHERRRQTMLTTKGQCRRSYSYHVDPISSQANSLQPSACHGSPATCSHASTGSQPPTNWSHLPAMAHLSFVAIQTWGNSHHPIEAISQLDMPIWQPSPPISHLRPIFL